MSRLSSQSASQSSQSGSQQKRLAAVESIRGLACLAVVFSHLSLVFFPYLHGFYVAVDQKSAEAFPIQSFIHHSPLAFFFSGTGAVFVFFVLSGYILTKTAVRAQGNPEKYGLMVIKRYPRLAIPVICSTLLAYLLLTYCKTTQSELSDWINHYGVGGLSFFGALYNSAIDVFFGSGESLYNPVLWTMQVELLGSFVIYWLCYYHKNSAMPYRKNTAMPWMSIVAAFVIVALLLLKILSQNLALGLLAFVVGYWLCLHGKALSLPMAVVILLAGLYFAGVHQNSDSYHWLTLVFGVHAYKIGNFAAGVLIVYSVLFCPRLSQWVSGRLTQWLGQISFSLYLIHLPVLATFGVYMFGVVYEMTQMYWLASTIAMIVTLAVSAALSAVFYRWVDLQGMHVSNRFAQVFLNKNKRLVRA